MSGNDRRVFIGQLLSRLALQDHEFAGRLGPLGPSGHRAVVPALYEDSVHQVSHYVLSLGGEASVVAFKWEDVDGATRPTTVCISRFTARRTEDEGSGDSNLPVSPDCTIGDVIETFAGSSVTFRLVDGDEFSIERPRRTELPEDGLLNA